MTKSLKPAFMKNVKIKESHSDFYNANKKQVINDIKDSIFVDCGETVYEPDQCEPMFLFDTGAKIAMVFNANIAAADGVKDVSKCVVNIIKNTETSAELDIFTYMPSVYLGKIKIASGRQASIIPAVSNTASKTFMEFVGSTISQIFNVLCTVMSYKCEAIDDIELPFSISKLPTSERITYMDWRLTTELREYSSNSHPGYYKYNGPYKFIKLTHGFDDIDDAKLINYEYEMSTTPFQFEMLEEVPFKNFILRLYKDGTPMGTVIQYKDGILHIGGMYSGDRKDTEGAIVCMAKLDLNEWHPNTPLFICNKSLLHSDIINDGEQWAVAEINQCINAWTEFMYKFMRLAPYSENVNNESLEIHTTRVVNNTSIYKIVVLGNDKRKRSTSGHKGGTHASPREHTRIAHKRTYKSGKVVYFPEVIVNEGHKGKVYKEYDATNM